MQQNQFDWNFRQVFGDTCPVEQVQEPDIISSLKFSQDGMYLAAGDKGGRVIIFQRKQEPLQPVEYEFYTEFQAHTQGFDPMRSANISEKVVQIQWLPKIGDALFLLTCNERIIKVWRVQNKATVQVSNTNNLKSSRLTDGSQLKVPRVVQNDPQPACQVRRTFENVSQYNVNSISVSPEQDRFLIADDLKVSIWDANSNRDAIEVVNLKPPKLDEACEVITYASFSPTQSSQFLYGTSSGAVILNDTRVSSLAKNGRMFIPNLSNSAELPYQAFGQISQQNDIAAGICSAILNKTQNTLLTRDFLCLRLWDVRMETRPLQIVPLHPQVREYAGRFLETDSIFDRFEVAFSGDGKSFVTGSYTDRFNIYSFKQNQLFGFNVQATRQVKRRSRTIQQFLNGKQSPSPNVGALQIWDGKLNMENVQQDPFEMKRKIQFLDWHPAENILAVATVSNLYIYASQ
uniref:Serine/threonine-protein phosphatase 2A 55 kDa regulatory subunit B n=1 Tax=Trepomonas sp. PC1 TaxID=1076344 RepID=A0A146KFU2_9EUKA|eukprot:JAP95640.1 Protein phosphatase PP2A regulatory subunit B [Trepomonas sp. PC1]